MKITLTDTSNPPRPKEVVVSLSPHSYRPVSASPLCTPFFDGKTGEIVLQWGSSIVAAAGCRIPPGQAIYLNYRSAQIPREDISLTFEIDQ
jgi:hypothetical protein